MRSEPVRSLRGQSRIRTGDGLAHAGFANPSLQPLGHLTVERDTGVEPVESSLATKRPTNGAYPANPQPLTCHRPRESLSPAPRGGASPRVTSTEWSDQLELNQPGTAWKAAASPRLLWSQMHYPPSLKSESNARPFPYQGNALPTELFRQTSGRERNRTSDLLLAKRLLSQLSYTPEDNGSGSQRADQTALFRSTSFTLFPTLAGGEGLEPSRGGTKIRCPSI